MSTEPERVFLPVETLSPAEVLVKPGPVVAHIYSLATGKFTGRTLRGPEEWCTRQVEVGFTLRYGDIDWRRNRVDLDTGELIPCKPDKPADTDDTNYVWDEPSDDWVATPTRKKLAREARAKRDELLAATDGRVWAAMDEDEPLPKRWKDYRKALRTLPDQPGFPHDIVWPTAPTK